MSCELLPPYLKRLFLLAATSYPLSPTANRHLPTVICHLITGGLFTHLEATVLAAAAAEAIADSSAHSLSAKAFASAFVCVAMLPSPSKK